MPGVWIQTLGRGVAIVGVLGALLCRLASSAGARFDVDAERFVDSAAVVGRVYGR